MASAFAALEQRVNTAVVARVSNAEAAIGTASPVPVIFDKPYLAGLGGFAESSVPQCSGKSDDLASAVQGTAITITASGIAVGYRVTEHQPDGTGFTTLFLEKA